MIRNLNICLHDIVATKAEVRTVYDITVSQLLQLNACIQSNLGKEYDTYTLYFDDSYKSFKGVVTTLDLGIGKEAIRCAVIVEQLGLPHKLTHEEVRELSLQGYGIDSHGMSHAALAIFKENVLQATPPAGLYQNSPYGSDRQLTAQEVLFQLVESKRGLEEIVGHVIHNFVLPYGLYNNETMQLIASRTNYHKILTCHTGLDTGQILAPRLLITQENIDAVPGILRGISDKYMLLTEPLL